jgi:hypothetical protein
MRAVEKFYSVAECALLLSLCDKTVIVKLKAREFGADVVNLGSELRPDYRVPASGLNAYLAARRLFSDQTVNIIPPGIAARTIGELRRKVERLAA